MRKRESTFLILLLLFLGLNGLRAQQTVTTAGGNASGSGGSVYYSVGQLVYKTNSNSSGSLAQGVQQPFEILVLAGLEPTNGKGLSLVVFPNPTTKNIVLRLDNFNNEKLNYKLYDTNGKLLLDQQITEVETYIKMGSMVNGCYFLKVSNDISELKSVKIFKNN